MPVLRLVGTVICGLRGAQAPPSPRAQAPFLRRAHAPSLPRAPAPSWRRGSSASSVWDRPWLPPASVELRPAVQRFGDRRPAQVELEEVVGRSFVAGAALLDASNARPSLP